MEWSEEQWHQRCDSTIDCPNRCTADVQGCRNGRGTASVRVVNDSRMRVRRSCLPGCHRDRPWGNGDMHWRNVRLTLFPEELYCKDSDTDLRQTYPWKDDFGALHRIRQDEGREQGDALMPLLSYLTHRQAHQALHRELHEYERLFTFADDVYVTTNPEIVEACTELLRGSSKCTRASPSIWAKQSLGSGQNQTTHVRCAGGQWQTSQRRWGWAQRRLKMRNSIWVLETLVRKLTTVTRTGPWRVTEPVGTNCSGWGRPIIVTNYFMRSVSQQQWNVHTRCTVGIWKIRFKIVSRSIKKTN